MSQNCNCHGSGGENSQTVAALLERPRYSPGLILEDSDLTSAVDYTRSLSRLLFRNLFGCGVICGLTVKVDRECGLNVTVSPGLALDGCGDPVQLPGPVTIAYDKRKDEQLSKVGSAFWVILCGKEKLCQPRALVCEADDYDGVTQATRIRAQSEVSISFEDPGCACRCPSVPDAQAAPADTPAADAAADAPSGGAATAPNGDSCHADHYTRVDCAEDCGCGTACDCGCCVLLAKAEFAVSNEAPDGAWTVQHKGVRRFVRAALVADPGGPGEKPPAPAPLVVPTPAPPAPEEKVVEPPPPPPPPEPAKPEDAAAAEKAAADAAAKAAADAAAAAAAAVSGATKPTAPS